MRKDGKRSAGIGRWAVLAGAALAVVGVAGFWPSAEATPTRVETLSAELNSPAGEYRKAMLIDELRQIDSSAAREALCELADSTDDRLAMLALRALGREGSSGSKIKVAAVYENTSRSPLVRATAQAVWCQMAADGGRSWATGKAWVKQHAGSNSLLCDQYAASKARHWAEESDQ
jgi:hypothetical protein